MTDQSVITSPSGMRDKAAALGERAADAIDGARVSLADGMDSAATRLHAKAENLPGVEKIANLTHGAADRMGTTAQFLRDHGTKEMMAEIEAVVKAHPGKSLLVAATVGFLAARALRGD